MTTIRGRTCWRPALGCGVALLVALGARAAEKVMIYDEQKGIIFVDQDSPEATKKAPALVSPAKTVTKTVERETTVVRVARKARPKEDIHIGRKKDPPDMYFRSGLEYFGNNDYTNALKNFRHADSLAPSPLHKLWIGKSFRRMNEIDSMLGVMRGIIANTPQSDVADDALFEIAFYYQTTDAYDSAINAFAQLAEQYPFGASYSNGGLFREVSREERRAMREESMSSLAALGVKAGDLPAMVRSFQKTCNLAQSGELDRQTVRAIKSAYAASLTKKSGDAERQKYLRRHTKVAVALGGTFSLAVLSLLITLGMHASQRRQIAELSQTLADLKPARLETGA